MRPIFCILLGSGILSLAVDAQGQTLADLARKERERKSRIESKVTITNDNVKAYERPAPATAPASRDETAKPAEPAKPASAAAPALTDNKGRDEKWWRTAFQQARDELKRAEDRIKVLDLELNRANRDYLEKSDLYNREMRLAAEINTLNSEKQLAQREAEQARQKIAQLEEELRRSQGPPSWAR